MPEIFTNHMRLPEPVVRALAHSDYVKRGDISVTELCDSPIISILKSRHEYNVDVSDNIWSLFGSAMHNVLESSAKRLSEDAVNNPNNAVKYRAEFKMSIKLDVPGVGIKELTGTTDLLRNIPPTIYDYKQTSVYKILRTSPTYCSIEGTMIRRASQENDSWAKQLNIYRWILWKTTGYLVENLRIVAILKDWSPSESKGYVSKGFYYPLKPIEIIEIPTWDLAETENYVMHRMQYHFQQRQLYDNGSEIIACSEPERWTTPGSWKIYKEEGDARAYKVFKLVEGTNAVENEAKIFFAQYKAMNNKAVMKYVPGTDVRCEKYCNVNAYCKYFQSKFTK